MGLFLSLAKMQCGQVKETSELPISALVPFIYQIMTSICRFLCRFTTAFM